MFRATNRNSYCQVEHDIMKTHSVKQADVKKKWVVVDAEGQTLGRLASEVASVLRGKNKPSFTPHLDCGDNVVILNAAKVKLTGNKLAAKRYYRYTGYVGGLKSATAQEVLESAYPGRVIEAAVKGMMPKNKLSRHLMKNLRVYAGTEHPHEAQKPVPMAPRTQK